MVGILTEALVAELILDIFPKPSMLAFIFAAGASLWTVVQPFVTGALLFGRNLFVVWLDLLDTGSRLFRLPAQAALWIVLALVILHLAVGGLGGWLGWKLGQVLKIRLGATLPEPLEI